MTAPTVTGLVVLDAAQDAQRQIAQQTAAKALLLWPLLTRGNVEANTPRWLQLMLALLAQQRTLSAEVAVRYLLAYRQLEVGDVNFAPSLPGPLNLEQVTTSLMVTGPTAWRSDVAKQQPDLQPPADWGVQGLPSSRSNVLAANVAAASVRHAVNGSRDVMDQVNAQDRSVLGYVRLTKANPCWFCAMLASRGPVYVGDSFESSDPRFHGPGDQKVHDSCVCTVVPVYTENSGPLLDRSRDFAALWKASGRNALVFRQMYEGRANA